MLKQKASEHPSACALSPPEITPNLQCFPLEWELGASARISPGLLGLVQGNPAEIHFTPSVCLPSQGVLKVIPKALGRDCDYSCPKLQQLCNSQPSFPSVPPTEHSPSFLFSCFPTLFPPAAIYRCLFLQTDEIHQDFFASFCRTEDWKRIQVEKSAILCPSQPSITCNWCSYESLFIYFPCNTCRPKFWFCCFHWTWREK